MGWMWRENLISLLIVRMHKRPFATLMACSLWAIEVGLIGRWDWRLSDKKEDYISCEEMDVWTVLQAIAESNKTFMLQGLSKRILYMRMTVTRLTWWHMVMHAARAKAPFLVWKPPEAHFLWRLLYNSIYKTVMLTVIKHLLLMI